MRNVFPFLNGSVGKLKCVPLSWLSSVNPERETNDSQGIFFPSASFPKRSLATCKKSEGKEDSGDMKDLLSSSHIGMPPEWLAGIVQAGHHKQNTWREKERCTRMARPPHLLPRPTSQPLELSEALSYLCVFSLLCFQLVWGEL